MPAQAVLLGGALLDEVLAVVDEETQVTLGTIEPGDRQVRLAQGRPGDGEGVDGIALARLTRPLRRAPAMSLGGTRTTASPAMRRSRSRRRDRLSAVLERPAPLTEALAAQRSSSRWPAGVARDGALAEPATVLVDGHDGVACACADRPRWSPCPVSPSSTRGMDGRTGRWTRLSGGDATLLTCLDGSSTRASRAVGCEVGDRRLPRSLPTHSGVALS